MKKSLKLAMAVILVMVLVAGLVMPGLSANKSDTLTGNGKTVKNVILMIADGGGFNQYLASDYYLYGKADASIENTFPTKLAMSTYSTGQKKDSSDDLSVVYNPENWNDTVKFQFGATDSAAAANAMSTGVKTWDAAVGIAPNDTILRHMTQDFEALGRSTGVVTSVPFSHATPAGFITHNSNRSNYAAIADEMLMSSATDVILGCGSPWYNDDGILQTTPKYAVYGNTSIPGFISQATWEGLSAGTLDVSDANGDGIDDPWTFIQTKAQFEALQTEPTPQRVVGIAQCYQTLQECRDAANWLAPAYTSPLNANVPSLETMTNGALNVLDNDKDGFFLMIEGGAVDWAGHFGQPGRLIEEMEDFTNTIHAVCNWVEKNSSWDETLLIVTADHETGFLSGSPAATVWPYNTPYGAGFDRTKPIDIPPLVLDPNPTLTPVGNNGIGYMPTMYYHLNTLDLKYAGMYWHSNQLVPFYAKGAGAEIYKKLADQVDPVRGKYLDNTEVSVAIRELLF